MRLLFTLVVFFSFISFGQDEISLVFPEEHSGRITDLHIVGDTVITGSVDGSVRFWDIRSGLLLKSIQICQAGITAIHYDPTKNLISAFSWNPMQAHAGWTNVLTEGPPGDIRFYLYDIVAERFLNNERVNGLGNRNKVTSIQPNNAGLLLEINGTSDSGYQTYKKVLFDREYVGGPGWTGSKIRKEYNYTWAEISKSNGIKSLASWNHGEIIVTEKGIITTNPLKYKSFAPYKSENHHLFKRMSHFKYDFEKEDKYLLQSSIMNNIGDLSYTGEYAIYYDDSALLFNTNSGLVMNIDSLFPRTWDSVERKRFSPTSVKFSSKKNLFCIAHGNSFSTYFIKDDQVFKLYTTKTTGKSTLRLIDDWLQINNNMLKTYNLFSLKHIPINPDSLNRIRSLIDQSKEMPLAKNYFNTLSFPTNISNVTAARLFGINELRFRNDELLIKSTLYDYEDIFWPKWDLEIIDKDEYFCAIDVYLDNKTLKSFRYGKFVSSNPLQIMEMRPSLFRKKFRNQKGKFSIYTFDEKGYYKTNKDSISRFFTEQFNIYNLRRDKIPVSFGKELLTEFYLSNKKSFYGHTIFQLSLELDRVVQYDNGRIIIQNLSGETISTIKYQVPPVNLTLKGNRLWIQTIHDNIELWDINSQKLLLTMKGYSSGIICYTPDNYYWATDPNLERKIEFYKDKTNFQSKNLKLKFHRPDIIMKYLSDDNERISELYFSAWEKRVKFQENSSSNDLLDKPTLKVDIDKVPILLDSDKLKLDVIANSSKSGIKQLNYIINGVPYTISVDNSPQMIEKTLTIDLGAGSNLIRVYSTDMNNNTSFHTTFNIIYNHVPKSSKLYFVGIGVANYRDSTMNLSYAAKDIRDMVEVFTSNTSFGEVIIDTFINNAVSNNLIDELKDKLHVLDTDDQVIFMYSGHGVLDDNFNYYLSTYNMDFGDPNKNGLAYSEITDLLTGISPRKKLVLLDACNSGEIDKDNSEWTVSNNTDTGSIKGQLFKTIKSKDPKASYFLMNELFMDLREGNGATVITSSGGMYFSYEDDKHQNGIYTYGLKEGLSGLADKNGDKAISVSELKSYLYRRVPELTGGKQIPTIRQENIDFDFRVY